MTATTDPVRPLLPADLDWVLDLAAARRARIVPFAPRFWRPAADARERHAPFLARQLEDAGVLALRTDHGFLIGAPRGPVLEVDDLALEDGADWDVDGRALLGAAGRRAELRLVCPVPEPDRRRTADALGLRLTETWWHRDLPSGAPAARPVDPALAVPGAAGRLVDAPPVYAPGGPVLLVSDVATGDGLAVLEQRAAAAGATVSVVTQQAGDARRSALLDQAGYRPTTHFLRGRPR